MAWKLNWAANCSRNFNSSTSFLLRLLKREMETVPGGYFCCCSQWTAFLSPLWALLSLNCPSTPTKEKQLISDSQTGISVLHCYHPASSSGSHVSKLRHQLCTSHSPALHCSLWKWLVVPLSVGFCCCRTVTAPAHEVKGRNCCCLHANWFETNHVLLCVLCSWQAVPYQVLRSHQYH